MGLDIQYNFGSIETETAIFIPDVILGSREKNNSIIKGISTNFALLYTRKITDKLDLSTTLGFTPDSRLDSENTRKIATISYNVNGTEFINDEDDSPVSNTKLVIPSKYTIGSGIGASKKWFVGLEYTFQENSKLGNRFDDITNATFEDSQKIVLGGYFIPKYNSYTSYWSRVNYRAGFRYENTGLVINSKEINDYGINFGLGLPVGGRVLKYKRRI